MSWASTVLLLVFFLVLVPPSCLGGLQLLLVFWPAGVTAGWPLFQWLLLLLSGYVMALSSSSLFVRGYVTISNPFVSMFWWLLGLVGVIAVLCSPYPCYYSWLSS